MEIDQTILNNNLRTKLNKFSWVTLALFLEHLVKAVINFVNNIPVMNDVWRERQELAQMSIAQLHDAGLDSAQVFQECRRGYFDIPTKRRIPDSTYRFTYLQTRCAQPDNLPTVS